MQIGTVNKVEGGKFKSQNPSLRTHMTFLEQKHYNNSALIAQFNVDCHWRILNTLSTPEIMLELWVLILKLTVYMLLI